MSPEGLVFDTRRHAIHDGPGIRVSIFLKGCPLSCQWCHNPEGIGFEPELVLRPERCIGCGECRAVGCSGAADGDGCTDCVRSADICPSGAKELAGWPLLVSDVVALAEAESPYFDAYGGGVTFTGGEPLAQAEFVLSATLELKRRGFHTVIDTSGYADSAVLLSISKHTDLFLYDIKHMDDGYHAECTGVSNKIIHDNIKLLADSGADIVISVPLVPGYNDDIRNLEATAAFVAGLKPSGRSAPYPVRILPFHNSARSKYLRMGREYACATLAIPDSNTIGRAASVFSDRGIETSIGGL
jgi:pyruvate formate lyase activating enzyme